MADAQTPVLTPREVMAVVLEADGSRSSHFRGTSNWAAHVGRAVEAAVLAKLAAQAPAQPDRAVMQRVRDAITAYHLALDRLEHGGVAAGCALDAIQDVLGMPWIQGAALSATMEKPHAGN